ncbi:histidine kinase [Leeuwenhoekiella sp.]|uniref:sensor histidine kinase n=1 Tax=Leeuwenhoekiella sp. TaxID=1977054 RepID=UPI0032420671
MSRKVLLHAGVWLVFLSLLTVEIYWNAERFPVFAASALVLNILLFYLNYLVLVPRFLLKKKTKTYILSMLLALVMVLGFRELAFVDVPPPHLKRPDDLPGAKPPFFDGFKYLFPLLISLSFIVIGTAIKVYEEWNRSLVEEKEIEAFKNRTELHYLKNQLSPHFLFNSLNSIYSLINAKSEEASEAVIMLSELMRYMLYQADSEFVALADELGYTQNYVRLQRLRIANNENVTLNIHGAVTHQKIRPLLLISFIENAFKYGTDYKGNTEVRIVITVKENTLEFECRNLIGTRKRDQHNSGVGLKNTTDRLKLLYAEKHLLNVFEEDSKFVVHLKLNLD